MANVNELLFDGIVKLLFAFFVFSVSMILTVSNLIFGNLQYYFACGILWILTSIYILKMTLHLKWIRDNLQLDDSPEPEFKLNVADDDMIKVLKLYANGCSLNDIMKQFRLSHPMQAKRLLRQSIKQLLEGEKRNVKRIEEFRCEASA